MDSPCYARFVRACHRRRYVRPFLERWGTEVQAVDEYGEPLLTRLLLIPGARTRRLVPWALMLGYQADMVDADGVYPCVHSPLYEACDCGMWKEVLLMLRRPLRREALESALYWACHAWAFPLRPSALPALRGLIEQLGGFCPEAQPHLLELLVMGGVYPLIPEALAAGYVLPPADSAWWGGDEEAWSSADIRGSTAWRRALVRFAAENRRPSGQQVCSPRRFRRLRRKYRCQYTEREWLWLLRSCC